MLVPTLYSICLDYLKKHTEDITCLDGIPFSPAVEQILEHLFTSDAPLNTSILAVVAESHNKELRNGRRNWTRLCLNVASVTSAVPSLIAVSKNFPQFITCLNLSNCNLYDDDFIHLRGFSNVTILDISNNINMTDRGFTLVANIATAPSCGMAYLEKLYIRNLKLVTDKSLKFISKISSLLYVDISNTSITRDVALVYLPTKGYKAVITDPPESTFVMNVKFCMFIKMLSFKYEKGQRPLCVNKTKADQPTLCFKRDAVKWKPVIPVTISKPVMKKRRLTTGDYFKMVEKELLGNTDED